MRVPGATSVALASLVARLPGAMVTLALVLAVTEHRSVASGGLAAAALVVGIGLGGPLRGRLVDRVGARFVLIGFGLGQSLALVVLLLVLPLRGAWAWPLVLVLATVAGGLLPPVGPVMRTLWGRLLRDHHPEMAHAAQSWESVLTDVVYLAAPSLVAVLTATASADVAIATAAALTAAGCLLLAISGHVRSWPSIPPAAEMRSPLRLPGVLPLLAVGFVFTGAITATELAAVRASHDEGAPAAAGWLIAALSLGSIIGGLAYGARRPPGGDRRHIAVCLALWITGHLLCALAPSLALIGVLLAVAGIGLAPAITAQYALIAAVTPDRARTEGFAWLNAAGQAGAATAAALAGLLAGPGPFLLSAALALVGISLLPRTRIRA